MTADAVVVLGAALAAPGVPGRVLRRRVRSAVEVANAHGAPFLVVSGGLTLHPPAEAEVMRDLAVEAGLDADRIVIEDQARNTFENAVYTGRIMRERGWGRVVVVTDAFHMRRALYVFRTLGLAAEPAPVVRSAEDAALAWYGGYAREALALAKSWYLFRIGAHKPVVEAIWGR